MEKKTNWRAVYDYLSDAHDYLEDETPYSKLFRLNLEAMMDTAWKWYEKGSH